MAKHNFWGAAVRAAGVLGIGLAFSALTGCVTVDSVSGENQGGFGQIVPAAKDFEGKGLVFTEVSFDIDDKGSRGDVFTYQALLKEAQKLGADAIVNVTIDIKREGSSTERRLFGTKKTLGIVSGKETWYGSALAIKYTDTIKSVETVTDGAGTTITHESPVIAGGTAGGSVDAENPAATAAEASSSSTSFWSKLNPLNWFKK